MAEVGEALRPQPERPHSRHRAGGGHDRRPRGSHEARHRERGRAQESAHGEGRHRAPVAQCRPHPPEEKAAPHAHEGRNGQRRVPDREPAQEARKKRERPGPREGFARRWRVPEGKDQGQAGHERHQEVRRRPRGGHEAHVGRSEGSESRGRPTGGRPVHAARQEEDEHDEQGGAQGFVGPKDAVGRAEGEAGRQEVRVESAVVRLVPEGRRQLAAKQLAGHEKGNRVVVRDRQGERRPVERPSCKDGQGQETDEPEDEGPERTRAHGNGAESARRHAPASSRHLTPPARDLSLRG